MKVVVVGGGKIGFYLAKTLIEHGHDPRIIESDKRVCEYLANMLDIPIIHGDGSSPEILELAGIEGAEALVSVTGQDQDNLIACQVAKRVFHVHKTVARVNNPKNTEVMKVLGVDIPISTTDNISRLLEREIDASAIKQLVALNRGEASLCELEIPEGSRMNGTRLMEVRLPEESIIVSITRQGKLIIPRGNTQILDKDKIIIMATDRVIHDISAMLLQV